MIISGSFLIGSVFSGTLLYWLDILFVKTLSNYYLSNIAYLVISFAFIAYVYRTNSKIFKELLDTIKEFCRDRVAIICFIAFVLFSTWFNYDTFSLSNGSITMSGEHGAI